MSKHLAFILKQYENTEKCIFKRADPEKCEKKDVDINLGKDIKIIEGPAINLGKNIYSRNKIPIYCLSVMHCLSAPSTNDKPVYLKKKLLLQLTLYINLDNDNILTNEESLENKIICGNYIIEASIEEDTLEIYSSNKYINIKKLKNWLLDEDIKSIIQSTLDEYLEDLKTQLQPTYKYRIPNATISFDD